MSKSKVFLRPPGVLSEEDFQARCVGCGQCAQVCNFHCVVLRKSTPLGVNMPEIHHEDAPCFLCMKCSDICPTNALNTVTMQKAGMGKAKMDMQKCMYHQEHSSIMCWTCYEKCPLKGTAIELQYGYMPHIIDDACVGCGVCEYVCPINAITTTPTRLLSMETKKESE